MAEDTALMATLPIRWPKTPLWLSETPLWRLEITLTTEAGDSNLASGANSLVLSYSDS